MSEENKRFNAYEREEVTICLCIITCQVRQSYMIQYALTQVRGLAKVDMTQAPLRAIRNVSVTYPHFSSQSPQPWIEMPCSAPPTQLLRPRIEPRICGMQTDMSAGQNSAILQGSVLSKLLVKRLRH